MRPSTDRNVSSSTSARCGSLAGVFSSQAEVPSPVNPRPASPDGIPTPPPPGPGNRLARLRELKAFLYAQHGGVCRCCGSKGDLQFDVIRPQGPEHHRMNVYGRWRWYALADRRGELQLLCQSCHSAKTIADTKAKITEKIKATGRFPFHLRRQ